MAFPIPAHLPRKKDTDVSTALLTKISETSSKSLTFESASLWVTELDDAIRQTKERIHERVHADLPAFEEQLASSRSIQQRLGTLSSNVDTLSTTLSHPETGMIPNFVMSLSQHASLAQEVADAEVRFKALEYLSRCRRSIADLTSLLDGGYLPEIVETCRKLDEMFEKAPLPLEQATILPELKRKYRSIKDSTQEQLVEAYSRAVVVSPTEIVIRSPVQVRGSDTTLSLSSVISSLSPSSLSDHLNSLRRDLTTYFIDHVLSQPYSTYVSVEGTDNKLQLFPEPPEASQKTTRILNLATIFTFLKSYLFPHIPPDSSFLRTLCKPLTVGLLQKLLIPSLPSSQDELPSYLTLLAQAVDFEDHALTEVLGDSGREREVKSWADGVASHYERKRRMELLDRARAVILREGDDEQFRVEVLVVPDTPKEPEPQPEPAIPPPVSKPIPAAEDESAWGFDGEGEEEAVEEDGWGLDVEPEPSPTEDLALPQPPPPRTTEPAEEQEDPGDAWGWNDDEPEPDAESESEDTSAWDDPWGEEAPAPAPVPIVAPKTATKLEKRLAKANGAVASPLPSPAPVAVPPPTPAFAPAPKQVPPPKPAEPRVLKESYLVSSRVQELIFLVEDVLREADELASSGLLPSGTSPVGDVIGQSAALILELYRALYPVTCANQLAKVPKRSMSFSNDCSWLSEDVTRVLSSSQTVASSSSREKLAEGQRRLKVLGDSWFEESIDNECQKINDILDGANSFTETGDQERFDECEASVNSVLQEIRKWAQQVKSVLTKSKYYNAIGGIVDAALSRMLQDIIALPDIPEVESHKLSELCRILSALEVLFVEDVEQPSFIVAYVPSWLKFSYLSELLEASMADISYLFEEGTLVDFEVEELVKLVRALFADTPLRANTVNKLMQGHPMHS